MATPKYYRAAEDIPVNSHVGLKEENKIFLCNDPVEAAYLGVVTVEVPEGKKVHNAWVVSLEEYMRFRGNESEQKASAGAGVVSQKVVDDEESSDPFSDRISGSTEEEAEKSKQEEGGDKDSLSWLPWR